VAIDDREIDFLGVEPLADPRPHLRVFGMVRIRQDAAEIGVSPDAARVFRRSGALARHAAQRRGVTLHDPQESDVVLPAIPEIIGVENARAFAGEHAERRCVLVDREALFLEIGGDEADALHLEGVKVAVRPAESDLEDVVQLSQGGDRRHVQAAPDPRLDPEQGHLHVDEVVVSDHFILAPGHGRMLPTKPGGCRALRVRGPPARRRWRRSGAGQDEARDAELDRRSHRSVVQGFEEREVSWQAIRQEIRRGDADEVKRTAAALRDRPTACLLVEGPPGSGKTSRALAVTRELRESEQPVLFVRIPSGLDQVERVILDLAEQAGRRRLLEVDERLRESAGRPDGALLVLDRAFEEQRFLLVVDDIDALGGLKTEARDVFADRFRALGQWLHKRAALGTTQGASRDNKETRLSPPEQPPYRLVNDLDHDVSRLWSAASHRSDLFALGLSRTLLTGDESTLGAERLDANDLLPEIWSTLTGDLQDILLHAAVHGRPLSRDQLLRTAPDATRTSVDEAVRALLLEQEGEAVWAHPQWCSWCATTLPRETVATAHERLANMFRAGLRIDDRDAGLRAVDILEAHRHLAAIPDLRQARELARYGVTVLLERAFALSFQHDYPRAAEIYAEVLEIHKRSPGGIGDKPWAYAKHYLAYNRQKADSTYPVEEVEKGYEASLQKWEDNALFWSRLALSRFYRRQPDRALLTLSDARKKLPVSAERQLRTRTVDRLVKRQLVEDAISVWGDFRATLPGDKAVEERLLTALARGFRSRVLRARGCEDTYFHQDVDITVTRVGSGYACQLREPPTVAKAASPEGALKALIEKLRAEVKDLNGRLTHTLTRDKIQRKGALLGTVDLVASGLLEGVGAHTWVMGWLERRGEEVVLAGQDGEVYLLGDEVESDGVFDRVRLARVRAGKGGEPAGPVEEMERPFEGDPDQVWREFQKRVNADAG